MVLAKITIKHEHSISVMGVAAYHGMVCAVYSVRVSDRRFVITVAPQNDICPQGSTYPMNAVAMVKNKMTTPTDHVCIKL
jgi:hypothetical protein